MSEVPRRRGYGPERLTDCGDDYVRVDLLDAAEKRIADLEAALDCIGSKSLAMARAALKGKTDG